MKRFIQLRFILIVVQYQNSPSRFEPQNFKSVRISLWRQDMSYNIKAQ